MSDLHDITYRLPGGLTLTYSTTLPTFAARLRHTIGGGIAIWRMWLREAGWMMLSGQVPYPSVVSLNIAWDIERVFRRLKWEATLYAGINVPRTHRSFTTKWSEEDGEFVGLCDQFPSMSWLDANEGKALAGIMALVARVDCEEVSDV